MKEFEKWVHEYSHGEQISQQYELADAWRAALKWVDGMLWLASGQVADEVKERIKKELL